MSVRDTKTVRGNRALQVLENAEFKAAFDNQRENVISSLERLDLDGTEQGERKAVELVRKLQAGIEFKRELVRVVQAGDREKARAAEDAKPKPFDPTAVKKPND